MTDDPQYFILKVGVCFCRCDIRVNDVPLLTQDLSRSRVDIELPLNQHVFTGDNTISFRLLPAQASEQAPSQSLDSPHVECSIELLRRPYGAPGPDTSLASIVYRGGSSEPFAASSGDAPGVGPLQSVSEPALAAGVRQVLLATAFPEWRWVRAPVIESGPVTARDLLAEYRAFWSALAAKDTAALRATLASNAREMMAAYYLPDLDDAWRVIGVDELLRNPDAELKPMPADLKLELYANGRLARLVTDEGDSPIRFFEGDTGLEAFITAGFCKGPSGQWVMIR